MPSPPHADTATISEQFATLFEPDEARALRRYLDWSRGEGFKLAIVEVSLPRQRKRLTDLIEADYPEARVVPLDAAPLGGIRAWLLDKLKEGPQPGVLVLTRFEERGDRKKLAAALNIERDELARAVPVPWLFVVHRTAAREFEQHAPDFCDFAAAWVSGKEEAIEPAFPIPESAEPSPSTVIPVGVLHPEDDSLLLQTIESLRRRDVAAAEDGLAAYDLARPPEERSSLRAMVAGVLAFARMEWQLARDLFAEALAMVTGNAALVGGVKQLDAFARWGLGEHAQAISQLRDDAISRFVEAGANEAHAYALALLSNWHVHRGAFDEAQQILESELLPLITARHITTVHILVFAANALVRARLPTHAIALLYEQVLPAAAPGSEEFGDALLALALAYGANGQADEERRVLGEELLPLCRLGVSNRLYAEAADRLASLLQSQGELVEALRIRREELLRLYERKDNEARRIATLADIASLHVQLGQSEEGVSLLEGEALPALQRLTSDSALGHAATRLAVAFAAAGRFEQALTLHREVALPAHERTHDDEARAHTYLAIGRLLESMGRSDDAIRCLQDDAIPTADMLDNADIAALARSLLILLLQRSWMIDGARVQRRIHKLQKELGKLTPKVAGELRAFLESGELRKALDPNAVPGSA